MTKTPMTKIFSQKSLSVKKISKLLHYLSLYCESSMSEDILVITNNISILDVEIPENRVIAGDNMYEALTAILYPKSYFIRDDFYLVNEIAFETLYLPIPNWLHKAVWELNEFCKKEEHQSR